MKTQIRALTVFDHGHMSARQGEVYEMNKGDADELVKAGLAVHVAEATQEAEAPALAPVEAVDDLVGVEDAAPDDKAEPAPANKMEKPVKNKGK